MTKRLNCHWQNYWFEENFDLADRQQIKKQWEGRSLSHCFNLAVAVLRRDPLLCFFFFFLRNGATQEIQNCHLGAGSRKTPPTCWAAEKVASSDIYNYLEINITSWSSSDNVIIFANDDYVVFFDHLHLIEIYHFDHVCNQIITWLFCQSVNTESPAANFCNSKIFLMLLFTIIIVIIWRKAPMSQ